MNPQQEKSILFFVHIGTDRFNHIKYDMFRRMCSAKPYWDEDCQHVFVNETFRSVVHNFFKNTVEVSGP